MSTAHIFDIKKICNSTHDQAWALLDLTTHFYLNDQGFPNVEIR